MSCPICKKDIKPTIKSSPSLTEGLPFDYAVCQDCGIGYHEPLSLAQWYEAYQNWGWANPDKVRYCTKQRSDERAQKQWAILKDIGIESMLDIGCGAGALVKKAIDSGIYARGIETSKAAIEAGKKWYQDDLFDIPEGRKFDAVCLHSVLEHVIDGDALIEQAIGYMEDTGILLIKVPNFNFQKQGWWAYAAEHPILYSHKAMIKLATKHNLTEWSRYEAEDRMTYIYERLS